MNGKLGWGADRRTDDGRTKSIQSAVLSGYLLDHRLCAVSVLLLFWWRSLPACLPHLLSISASHTLRRWRWRPAGGSTFLTCCSTSFEKKELAVAARKLVCFRLHDCQPNDDGLYIVTPACMHSGECNIFSPLKYNVKIIIVWLAIK